jgi:hypothetical protein
MSTSKQSRRGVVTSALLWIVAILVMFLAADFQERTGPTKEFRGSFEVGGETFDFALVRSGNTDAEAPIVVPDPGRGVSSQGVSDQGVSGQGVSGQGRSGQSVTGQVYYKRYPTDDPFSPLTMEPVAGDLQALLPTQPAAGKLEYYVVLETGAGAIRIPEEETLIIRYKDPVPLAALVPHVICMFLALLIGVRTALGAAFYPAGVRKLAWTTLGFMTVGGMILGPVVQKYAFGAFWTGWPFGYDLTDNKTLIMWIVWVLVALVLWKRREPRDWVVRGSILGAAVVMMVVYLIPHSLRGSEFDYSQLEDEPGVAGSVS